MCAAALSRWAGAAAGQLKVLRPSLSLEAFATSEGARPKPQSAWTIGIEGSVEGFQEVVCGPTLLRLHKAERRLPITALSLGERASWKTIPIVTCDNQLSLAEWLLWGGCSDATEHAAETELEGEDLEAYLASVPSRAALEAELPAWFSSKAMEGRPLSTKALKALATRTSDPLAAAVASTLVELQRLSDELPNFHESAREEGGEFIAFGAMVRYSKSDSLPDLTEQMCNYALEGGQSYECVLNYTQPVGDRESFGRWIKQTSHWFRAVRSLDYLLWLLGGADSRYG